MLADDGVTPILMDFGSCMKARIPIENRSQALLQQVWSSLALSLSLSISQEQSPHSDRVP